ncbi:MAG TPA: sulfite exporter TauE/SafE family protein [Acidobacteriaceae bacterium]|nr:sulfite exporter TauE/SafE family protein [Acidobacteriaceae bacterium]
MNSLELSLVLGVCSLAAGLLGALTGLGGGVVIVPLLALAFHVDIHYAIGASLMSVIATSSGSASAYVREGFSNVRIGMFLEVATTLGALLGAWLATITPTTGIAIVFGCILIFSALMSNRRRPAPDPNTPVDPLAVTLRLNSTYPVAGVKQPYNVRRVPLGFGLMFGAGTLSGLLGIGSGAVKVLAMDEAMQTPFKVSTTTSNFMIGVTAAASAGIYLSRGYIDPSLVMPVTLGVLAGSLIGAKLLVRTHTKSLRIIFGFVIAALGVEMIYSGLTGKL